MYEQIRNQVCALLSEVPSNVTIVAAAKTRTPEEINAALEAGIQIIGENYVQEAEAAINSAGKKARWHFIGHLQLNKVKKAVKLFDLIETVDSLELAKAINHHAMTTGIIMPVLIEVNTARESTKSGVLPEHLDYLAESILRLQNIRLEGLMAMGPHPESGDLRKCFTETRRLYDQLKTDLPDANIHYLSMGMSDSYHIAIEEGANLIRLGTAVFGPRQAKPTLPDL